MRLLLWGEIMPNFNYPYGVIWPSENNPYIESAKQRKINVDRIINYPIEEALKTIVSAANS